jgi:hypothetical protein
MEPRRKGEVREDERPMEGPFGRWKGDGIVVVAAPTSACVSSRFVRPTRLPGRRSPLDRRACATQAEACASMSAPACGACGDDGGGLCRRGAKSLLRREPNIPADLLRALFGNATLRDCVHARSRDYPSIAAWTARQCATRFGRDTRKCFSGVSIS